ncbi:unnamed protein product [Camellia sinensis]
MGLTGTEQGPIPGPTGRSDLGLKTLQLQRFGSPQSEPTKDRLGDKRKEKIMISHLVLFLTMKLKIPRMENPLAQSVEDLRIDLKNQCMLDSGTAESEVDEFWPLSGKPYFHVFLSKSQLKPLYQLHLPVKAHPVLPSSRIPVVLTYRGKNWEIILHGDSSRKRFDPPSWRTFASDNDLKVGDACLFELVEFSSSNHKFRVQILRGDFPSVLLERVNGETPNTPIVVD